MKSYPDKDAARDLVLYTINTGAIYRTHTTAVIETLRKKARKNQYDTEKAVKAWEAVAETGAKRYAREFATPSEWYTIFNKATRRLVAVEMEEYYREQVMEE